MRYRLPWILACLIALLCTMNVRSQELDNFIEYRGTVVDDTTNERLVFANLMVKGTNMSVITNGEGEFLLKVPTSMRQTARVVVAFLGYQPKEIPLTEFDENNQRIGLVASTIALSEINVVLPKNAKELVKKVFDLRKQNNPVEHTIMTAFYRETIKKGRKNASLAEAIVQLYKEPYLSLKSDKISLYKSRKSTDYSRLDTLAVKLQGGPFNALYIDLMKYPEYVFTQETMKWYDFSFGSATTVNDRPVYVVNFNQLPGISEPLFQGKLFIDSNTLALVSAVYSLNLTGKPKVENLFVRKKPLDVTVIPTKAAYRVDYREKNGKWYYGYSNVQLALKIKKKRSWFNKNYSLMSEMAVTDWSINEDKEKLAKRDKMKTTIVISDEASGFSDPAFWGAYNVIEPEKSIEIAIEKIRKQLKRNH
ncbi:carboxypeptidase-like regulatory domain-containing protein [Flavobacteriaceae bacterium F08102]|nr:carboxypeptidase-like regulatory domain-containing protein [Flavobacteriaceae bacterium F08102]